MAHTGGVYNLRTIVQAITVPACLVITVLGLASCTGSTGNPKDYSFTSYTKLGKLIPVEHRKKAQNIGGDLLSGGTTTLSKSAGTVQLVNFFASWCGPCQIETPQLAKLAVLDRTVHFLGVDIDDEKDSARTFLSQSHVHYPVVYDQQVRVPLQLGDIPAKPPFTVLIDKSGRVAAVYARRGDGG